MSGESKLQIALKADESLVISSRRSTLIARGRRDAAGIASRTTPEPRDRRSEDRRLAEGGDELAQYRLGVAYYCGSTDVPPDFTEAMKWYRKAALQGHPFAQYSLGAMYDFGQGVPQEHAEAAHWYRKAAEQGHGPAQQSLGRLYRDGRGVAQNFSEALPWYLKAAANSPYGNGAKVELGESYYRGIGVAQNYSEAVKWFREAMPSYGGIAELYLGYAYAYGRGVPQDSAEAIRWWREAVDREDSHTNGACAHFMLGDAYYKGLGVPQDYVLAYMWFAIAAVYRSGEEKAEAAKMRDEAARMLTLEQLAEGQRLAREWDAERYGQDLDFKAGQ